MGKKNVTAMDTAFLGYNVPQKCSGISGVHYKSWAVMDDAKQERKMEDLDCMEAPSSHRLACSSKYQRTLEIFML